LDTNVILSALRSRRGASNELLRRWAGGEFDVFLSNPLLSEYQGVLHREARTIGKTHEEIETFLDGLCLLAIEQPTYFLWRPTLQDPKDDMVLECAVAAQADFLVTFNLI